MHELQEKAQASFFASLSISAIAWAAASAAGLPERPAAFGVDSDLRAVTRSHRLIPNCSFNSSVKDAFDLETDFFPPEDPAWFVVCDMDFPAVEGQ